jgi:hypothetical protein
MQPISQGVGQRVSDSVEAMEEYGRWSHLLTEAQRSKLLRASLSRDGNQWCILSGSDLTFDRAGFGTTIAGAMRDYVSFYVRGK